MNLVISVIEVRDFLRNMTESENEQDWEWG